MIYSGADQDYASGDERRRLLDTYPAPSPPKANRSSRTNKISANRVVALTGGRFVAVSNAFGIGGDVAARCTDLSKKSLL